MGKAVFTDKSADFLRKNDSFVDMVTGHMSLDIERFIKMDAGTPVDKGIMKGKVTQYRNKRGGFRVVSPVEYSEVQELGKRDGIIFKNYTTAGTSAGWFKRSIDAITKNRDSYVHEAARALGL